MAEAPSAPRSSPPRAPGSARPTITPPTSRAWACDCAMLLVRVYCDLGLVEPFDPRPYTRDWMMHRNEEKYLGFLLARARMVESPDVGDVVLFRVGRCFAHGGIVSKAEPLTMIHAHAQAGRVIEDEVERCALARGRAPSRAIGADRVGFLRHRSNTVKPDYTGLQIQTAVSTLPIPIVWGRNKLAGNVIWYQRFVAVPSYGGGKGAGGKGGLGGSGSPTWLHLSGRPHHRPLRGADFVDSDRLEGHVGLLHAARPRHADLQRDDAAKRLAVARRSIRGRIWPTREPPSSAPPPTTSARRRRSATTISRSSARSPERGSTGSTPTRRW